MKFEEEVHAFLKAANEKGLRMLMVGGGAVNYYGYKRHSADVDLWVEPTKANFDKLVNVLKSIGYLIDELPQKVLDQQQNVSIKISPDQSIELITRFNPGCSFEVAWERSVAAEIEGQMIARYKVLALNDLIESKLKSGRAKDLLDVQELKRLKGGD